MFRETKNEALRLRKVKEKKRGTQKIQSKLKRKYARKTENLFLRVVVLS